MSSAISESRLRHCEPAWNPAASPTALIRASAAIVLIAAFAFAAACTESPAPKAQERAANEAAAKWQAKHEADYRREWVSIAGLFDLKPGVNTAGSAPTNDIVLPASVPPKVGRFVMTREQVRFEPSPDVHVTLDDEPVTSPVDLLDDRASHEDELMIGDVRLVIHVSGERRTLRVRDPNGPLARGFAGFSWFPIDAKYRVIGRLIRDQQPRILSVVNTYGDVDEYLSEGVVEFTLEGQTVRLRPFTTRPKRFYFVFRDGSSGKETYETARFLYADLRDDGTTVLDFNEAYNPPCAFNPNTTCPIPLRENRLPVKILAGEKAYPVHVPIRGGSGSSRPAAAEPVPEPAIAAALVALNQFHLVAVGEVHRNEQVHAFVDALVSDPRFLPDGGDIVVEFGNARYQEVMDRYVAGATVSSAELVRVWRDTVNILVWDAPVYERLFRVVRDVNRSRSIDRQLRVILADPAIDWNTIHDRDAWERIAAVRDRHAADVITREVLTRGRRALLIFGSGHVQNERAFDPYGRPNLAALLQREHPGLTLFVVADWMTRALDVRLADWRPPVLVRLKGHWLGEFHLGPPTATPTFEEIADAFLYLGPTTSLTTSTPSPSIYRDPVYLRELLRRDAIQGGANADELRRLRAMVRGR